MIDHEHAASTAQAQWQLTSIDVKLWRNLLLRPQNMLLSWLLFKSPRNVPVWNPLLILSPPVVVQWGPPFPRDPESGVVIVPNEVSSWWLWCWLAEVLPLLLLGIVCICYNPIKICAGTPDIENP